MKKVLLGGFAFALLLVLNGCTEAPKAPTEDAETTDVGVEVLPSDSMPTVTAMGELVASAKADGANWTVEQWQKAYRNMAVNIKPMMDEIKAKVIEEPDLKKAARMNQLLESKYKSLTTLLDEFVTLAEGTENGKQVIDDEDFTKQVMEECGFPDI